MTSMQSNGGRERVCALLLAAFGTMSCGGDTADVGGEPETSGGSTTNDGSGGGSNASGAGGTASAEDTNNVGGGGSSPASPSGIWGDANPPTSCDELGDALDSRWIVFDSDAGQLARRIYAVEAKEGATPRPLTPADVIARDPAVSPNGSELAYVADGMIRILNLSSGEDEDVVAGEHPAWYPDGKGLAYHADRGIWRLDREDGTITEVTACSDCALGGYQNPEISQSGDLLAMDEETQIYLLDLESSEAQVAVMTWTTTMTHPTLSANADWLVAAVMCDGPWFSLWLHEAGLPSIPCVDRRLTPASVVASNPAWGPDAIIAYELGETSRDIALMDVGSKVGCVLEHEGEDRNPIWAPEGFEPPSDD